MVGNQKRRTQRRGIAGQQTRYSLMGERDQTERRSLRKNIVCFQYEADSEHSGYYGEEPIALRIHCYGASQIWEFNSALHMIALPKPFGFLCL
jgi:hypothetical protein